MNNLRLFPTLFINNVIYVTLYVYIIYIRKKNKLIKAKALGLYWWVLLAPKYRTLSVRQSLSLFTCFGCSVSQGTLCFIWIYYFKLQWSQLYNYPKIWMFLVLWRQFLSEIVQWYWLTLFHTCTRMHACMRMHRHIAQSRPLLA